MEVSACTSGANSDRRMRPVTIDDLPTEMLCEVFSYLDLKDLSSACSVSSRWKGVGNGVPLTERNKYIITSDESHSEVARTFQTIPYLRNIEISHSRKGNVKFTLLSLLTFCTDIRDLDIDMYIQINSTLLHQIVKKFKNLKSLSIPLSDCAPQVIGQISACLNLQKLVIYNFDYSIDLKPIADGCPNLRELDICCCTYTTDDFSYLLRQKKHLLRLLLFNPTCFSGSAARALSECTRLEHVGCLGIMPTEIEYFLNAISNLSGLKVLELAFRGILAREEAAKISKCSFSCNLTVLTITCDSMTREFSRTVVSCLPNVEELHVIINMPVTDTQGLYNWLEMKRLKRLDIMRWPFSEDWFEKLIQCKQIKYLEMDACSGLNDQNASRLVKEIELVYLSITDCHSLSDEFLKSFPRCDKLKELHVDIENPLEQTVAELKMRQPTTRIIVRNSN